MLENISLTKLDLSNVQNFYFDLKSDKSEVNSGYNKANIIPDNMEKGHGIDIAKKCRIWEPSQCYGTDVNFGPGNDMQLRP